jgi:hypothetical protein
LDFIKFVRCDMKQMFTPPKAKSVWEAATSGSTGGWAKGIEPWGPAITGAFGALSPFTAGITGGIAAGMGAAGMAGKGTGFQGTDKGWSNLGSTALGALSGWGLGGLGAGIGGAVKGAAQGGLGAIIPGFTKASGTYFNAPFNAIGNMMKPVTSGLNTFGVAPLTGSQGTMGTGAFGANAAQGGVGANFGANALAPWTSGANGMNGISNFVNGSRYLGAGQPGTTGTEAGANASAYTGGGAVANPTASTFSMQNMLDIVTKGQSMLGSMGLNIPGLGGAPRLQGNREEALSAINTPDLQQARGMLRDIAMMNPMEMFQDTFNSATEATLAAHRRGVEMQKKITLQSYGARGQVPGKSGAVDKYLRETDRASLQQENDYIAAANESRAIASIKLKVDAVQNYYNMATADAVNLLAAEGYVNPIDAQNYLATLQEYQTAQQLQGYMQLAPMLQGGR